MSPLIASATSTIWNALRKLAVAALLLGLLFMYDPNTTALAVSGSRMGGKYFSKSTSSLSSSSTPSSPSSSSSSSKSDLMPTPKLGSSSSSSSLSRSYLVPTRNLELSYSDPYHRPAVEVAAVEEVGAGFGFFLIFVLVGFVIGFILASNFLSVSVPAAAGKTTVLKLQVGLLGSGHTLQRDLNRIAEVADTSSSGGLSYILTETTLALFRHPDYCISAYSSVEIKQDIEDAEKRFDQLSFEERIKFDEETLVGVNNIKRQMRSLRENEFSNEYTVITILAAVEGAHKLPGINGRGSLKEALQKLGSIPSSKLLAAEVLWNPQDENDTLSDYPLLRPL